MPCVCRGSGYGLDSCGELCCAHSPYTDPDPNGKYYFGKGGTRTSANLCYENIPCEGAHFQCFQERAHHGHRLQAVGAKCKDLVRILQTHTSAQLGCSNWYDTLTLAEGPDQLATLRRDTKLNFVRPKGGNTVALESSFAACGSWGVAKAEKIYALLAFTTPSICLRPNRTPGTCNSPCISCCDNAA